MDIFGSYSYIPHGDGQNGIFRRSCLLSPFSQPSSLRLYLLLLFLLFPAAGAGGPSCCFLHGPRLENVVALTRPSINDYMQVLCYIATQANKPSCPSRGTVHCLPVMCVCELCQPGCLLMYLCAQLAQPGLSGGQALAAFTALTAVPSRKL